MMLVDFEFTINLGSIAAFFIGIFSGVILFLLIYFLYVMVYLNKKEINLYTNDGNITEEDIKKEIELAQTKFLELRKQYGVITLDSLKGVSIDLINNIAKMYYPDSKQPLAELTIKELILLDKYLIDKIEDLLNKIGLKFVKKIKLNSLLAILNMKRSIDNSNVIKATRKVGKFTSGLLFVLNFLNPVRWIRIGIINPSINVMTKKICLLVIAIIGQETYHIYSKQAFLDPVLDKDIEKLIEIIEDDQDQPIEIETKKTKVKL